MAVKTKKGAMPAEILSSTRDLVLRERGLYHPYSDELATWICANIASGLSMRAILDNDDMPSMQAVWTWLKQKPEFTTMYELACKERAEAMGEDLLAIADDGRNDWMEDQYMKGSSPGWKVNGEAVQRSKLRVDSRMWLMSKMNPRKYGNNLDITSDGKALPAPIYGGKSTTIIEVTEAEVVEPQHKLDT